MKNDETSPNAQMTKKRAFRHSSFIIDSSFDIRASSFGSGLISNATQLEALLPLIAGNDRIGADTEADSLHCYREKLCLLQISLSAKGTDSSGGEPEGDFLIDPLAGNDLTPLTELLAGKEIVLHGADYDLRLLRRDLNFRPTRLFDTMIAARLLGHREFSYASLVERFFGVALAKGSQKANWALRPLSSQMKKYATNDTHYLLPLAERLESELVARDRLDWFRQSCARAIEATATDRERDGEDAWRIRGAGLMRGREAAILRAIWHWRDKEAELADRPAFHVLRNDQLMEVARTMAANGEMPAFRHLSERRERGFKDAINQALALSDQEWPQIEKRRGKRPTPEVLRAADEMRQKRDRAATKLGIEPSFIAPRAAIDAIASKNKSAEEFLTPWQRQLIGLA